MCVSPSGWKVLCAFWWTSPRIQITDLHHMMETMLKHPSSDEDVDVSHALKTSTWRVDADIVLSSFIMCYGYWLSKVGLIASVACTLSEHFGIFVCYKCIFSLCYWYLFWKGCSTACEKTQCSLLVCFFTYHVGGQKVCLLAADYFWKVWAAA